MCIHTCTFATLEGGACANHELHQERERFDSGAWKHRKWDHQHHTGIQLNTCMCLYVFWYVWPIYAYIYIYIYIYIFDMAQNTISDVLTISHMIFLWFFVLTFIQSCFSYVLVLTSLSLFLYFDIHLIVIFVCFGLDIPFTVSFVLAFI